MRRSIVPAQITSVEDKIAGNISVSQGILMGIPIVGAFAIATLLPPHGQFVDYKYGIIACLVVLFGMLAVRISGRIIFDWIGVLVRYGQRPRYYVHGMNSLAHRVTPGAQKQNSDERSSALVDTPEKIPKGVVSDTDMLRFQRFADSSSSMAFEIGKKGALHVRVREKE